MEKDEKNRPETEEAAREAQERRSAESAEYAGVEERAKAGKRTAGKQGTKRAGKRGGAGRKFLSLVQHIALAVVVIAVCVVAGASGFRVDTFQGTYRQGYSLSDQSKHYEETDVFKNLFGWACSDVIRHGVVSGQMETDGGFDGSKVIDVTAYNYRQTELPAQYVTAEYYLEDLLKWQNYGFETRTEIMTPEQADAFLADRTRVTFASLDELNEDAAALIREAGDDYSRTGDGLYQTDVSGNLLGSMWIYTDDGEPLTAEEYTEAEATYTDDGELLLEEQADADGSLERNNILVNRYLTVDGGKLEDYVSDWNLYYDLCNQVKTAAGGLAYNYKEYLQFNNFYKADKTNMRYLIVQETEEGQQVFTNLTTKDLDNPAFAYAGDLIKTGTLPAGSADASRYIYYAPADMVYETNTGIDEETVLEVAQVYDYAYPESTKIWVGVDTSYPVQDGFWQGSRFYNYGPYLWQGVAAALTAGVLYLLLWFWLTCTAGRDTDEEGNRCISLQPFDRSVPTEGALAIACGAVCIGLGVFVLLTEFLGIDPTRPWMIADMPESTRIWGIGLLAVYVFIADWIAMFFFYSLVRRIKARTLWKNSCLKRLSGRAVQFGWKVYDNSDIVLRTWLPYAAFVLFNIVLLMVVFVHDSGSFLCLFALFVLLAVDLFVGIILFRNAKEQQEIVEGIETIAGGALEHQVDTDRLHGNNLTLANSVNSIGKGIKEAVETSMKDERMKADLITNVSHDIKTPLTSIINYVDLIKREQVDSEKIRSYINVLDEKSQRLKQLTDDLVEASKISSGNINLHFEKIDLTELMNQTLGEFSEKFEQKRLTAVMNVNVKNAVIEADSRRIWRVIENLFNNIFKYALEGTRVYLTIDRAPDRAEYIELSVKNISAQALNCSADELTERFIRGDESRTTEGSGLGLSIAKNLTEAQGGTFAIQLDGDLFKVVMTFPAAQA